MNLIDRWANAFSWNEIRWKRALNGFFRDLAICWSADARASCSMICVCVSLFVCKLAVIRWALEWLDASSRSPAVNWARKQAQSIRGVLDDSQCFPALRSKRKAARPVREKGVGPLWFNNRILLEHRSLGFPSKTERNCWQLKCGCSLGVSLTIESVPSQLSSQLVLT